MRYAFAGDREVSSTILEFMIANGYKPLALMVSEQGKSTHSEVLKTLSGLEEEYIFIGKEFSEQKNIEKLKSLDLDYIIGIHFPYIIKKEVLEIPKIGFLNLHPAFLPYNKGWHTPSWAILEKSEYGATLHFMSEELDKGDIINQKKIEVYPEDTADSLYRRVLKLEVEIFKDAFNELKTLNPSRIPQKTEGTSHKKSDLFKVNKVDLSEKVETGAFIDKLRAFTTNNIEEAVFFEKNSQKYAVQVQITKVE